MPLELRLLGGLEVLDERGRPLDVSSKKARALLAYLAAHAGRRLAREQVASLLWGDISADEHARRSLRQALSVLRKLLPQQVIDSGRDELAMPDDSVRTDVHELEVALKQADRDSLGRAVTLYRGDFLEGFSARADGFDAWADRERTRLRERVLEAMERLGRLERDAGRLEAAIGLAMRVVALEPTRESAHRDLMELHVVAQAPGRALKQYEICRRLLARELGIAPSPATTALAARIRSQPEALAAASLQPAPAASVEQRSEPAAISLRQVVVVHVATGFDSAPAARAARSEARACLTRFEGRILRDTPDTVAAVYGAEASRGSSLEQALGAALALANRLEALGLGRRIGVASGQALVEEGSDGLVVNGEVVSLASSLHQVGSLVISGAVRESLGGRAQVRECARVRGVAAWELLALGDAGAAHSSLVGRDFELAQLVAALSPCLSTGRGRAFVVRGEPGIGKTTLVAHFSARAREAGFDVHRQHVLDFGRGSETDALDALARSLLLESSSSDLDESLARAVARGELAPSDLAYARQMFEPNGARSEIDSGPEETSRRQDAILEKLLRAQSAQRPRLLWIEDIHWASAASLRRLTKLLEVIGSCRALLVLTTRIAGEPDDPDWRRAIKGRAVSTIDLPPLDDETARSLLSSLARRGAAAADAARIIERASGNPLFLEQLCWASSDGAIPGSVQALVQSRLDMLEPSSRRTLEAAAVLGQELEESALSAIMEASELDLSELLEHGLLRSEPSGLAFTHALVRDAVYASLPDERRSALHRAAARHYAGKSALLRAGHLERARDPAAVDAHLEAAEQQRRRSGMLQALEHADRALGLATDSRALQRVSHFRGEVLRELGRSDEALAAFEAARQHADSTEQIARAWLGSGSVLRLLDRHDQALDALERARSLIDQDALPELASHIHFMRGNVLFPSGDAEACLEEHRRALELAERARSPLAEAQALSGMADAHYVAARMQSATALFERCEALAAREGLTHLERTSRSMRWVMQVLFLRVREAAERCQTEAASAEEAGALRTAAVLRTGACLALAYLGDWSRMASEAERAVELTRRSRLGRFEALSLSYLAIARSRLGQAHDALLDRALELSHASGMAFSSGIVHAALLMTAGDDNAIRHELRRGLAALDAGAVAHGRIFFLSQAILMAVRLPDPNEARRLADELERSSGESCELVSLFVDLGRGRTTDVAERARQAGLAPVLELLAER